MHLKEEKMFVIIEWNGVGAEGIMGLVLMTNGKTRVWDTAKRAGEWAKKNCAFHYKVIELY